MPKFELLKTVYTPHGNAAWLAWSDDGQMLFLANNESDRMSAVKIDASDLNKPRIVARNGDVNFLWAVAERNGLLVFHPSYGTDLIRVDPRSFVTVWKRTVGPSRAVETDGVRIFIPVEGKPGNLVVLDASGTHIARVAQADGWANVYGIAYDETTKRLYVGAGEKADQGYPGGIYIYDVSGPTPQMVGKIPVPSSGGLDHHDVGPHIAVHRSRIWRQFGNRLEVWDASNPASPRVIGSWVGATEHHPRFGELKPQLGMMRVNQAGTRLYVNYNYGRFIIEHVAGFMIFDVAGDTPRLLVRQDWKLPSGYWHHPTGLALSPDEKTLAVSYLFYGFRLFDIAGDRVQGRGTIATAGEARDVFVDNLGMLHIFATYQIQTTNPQTGETTAQIATGTRWDGGWIPFKDGTILMPGAYNEPYVLRIRDGTIHIITRLDDPGRTPAWTYHFEDPHLYSASYYGSKLSVHEVGAFDGSTYPTRLVVSLDIPKADRSRSGGKLVAMIKNGNLMWGVGPDTGVVVIDVSSPSAPKLVFHDPFSFGTSGDHIGIIAARNRIYVGAGDAGLLIYDPLRFTRRGAVRGLNVNFLDKVDDDFLLVANYWYPPGHREWGLYIYDLRANPDAPALAEKLAWGANFRVRAYGRRIYRVPLFGVDILEMR